MKQNYDEGISIFDAFKALNDVSDDDVMSSFSFKHRKRQKPVDESISVDLSRNINKDTVEDLIHDATDEQELQVIDVNAEDLEHLKGNKEYIGQMIIKCKACQAPRFIDAGDLIESDSEADVYNVEDECPNCHIENKGFEIVGQVGAVPSTENKAVDSTDNENKDSAEVDVQFDNDEKVNDTNISFDNDVATTEDEAPSTEIENNVNNDNSNESELEMPTLLDQEEEDETSYEEEPMQKYEETDVADDTDLLDLPKLGDEIDRDDVPADDTEDNEEVEATDTEEEDKTNESIESEAKPSDDKKDEEKLDEAIVVDKKPIFECVGDFFNCVVDANDADNCRYYNGNDLIYTCPYVETPEDICKSKFNGFNSDGDVIVFNIDSVSDGDYCLRDVLDTFTDGDCSRICLCDQDSCDTVFNGCKKDAIDRFGDCAFISIELPNGVCILTDPTEEYETIQAPELDEEDELVRDILKQNNLSANQLSNPTSTEYWINDAIACKEDVEPIYETFVLTTGDNELIERFKKITGYKDIIDEAKEAYKLKYNIDLDESFEDEHLGDIRGIDSDDDFDEEADEFDRANVEAEKAAIDAEAERSIEDLEAINETTTFGKLSRQLNALADAIDKFASRIDDKVQTITDDNHPGQIRVLFSSKELRAKAKSQLMNKFYALDATPTKVQEVEDKDIDNNVYYGITYNDILMAQPLAVLPENVQSFKTRKELAEVIQECKNNNRPYIVTKSLKEGFRYDLVQDMTSEVKCEEALAKGDKESAEQIKKDIQYYEEKSDDQPYNADKYEEQISALENALTEEITDNGFEGKSIPEIFEAVCKQSKDIDEIVSYIFDNYCNKDNVSDLYDALETSISLKEETKQEGLDTLNRLVSTLGECLYEDLIEDVKAFDKTWAKDKVTFDDGFEIKLGDKYKDYSVTGFDSSTNSIKLGLDSYDAEEVRKWLTELDEEMIDIIDDEEMIDIVADEDVLPIREALHGKEEVEDFFTLCDEIGLETFGDLKRFADDNANRIKVNDLLAKHNLTLSADGFFETLKDYRQEELPIDFEIIDSEDTSINYDDPLHVVQKLPESEQEYNVEQFEKEINEYFKEAYDEYVLYTAESGKIDEENNIVVEGQLTYKNENTPVEFLFKPQSLDEDIESRTYTVYNNLSEEVFEFNLKEKEVL